MSTTIRVDAETHARLVELSRATGDSLIDTVRDATEALRRQRFASRVAAELETLRQDESAWQDYLSDAAQTEVGDGLD
ncbi:MAG: hypothetical protein QNJ75_11520 [Acidimicrobiia bacterium]|nr:hypothetical protein [Acidimicrobiia bacterium]